MKLFPQIFIAVIGVLTCNFSYGDDTLCTATEHVVFSCHIETKTVSLCRAGNAAPTLTYRFGRVGAIELDYSSTQINDGFHTSNNPVYGGSMTIVAFSRGGFEYQVYSKVGREENDDSAAQREPLFEDGVVISEVGKPLKQLVCDDGGEGFREDMSWLPSTR